MKLDDLVILMENKSYMLNMGAGKLAKQYKWSNAEIGKAIMEAKSYRVKEYSKPDKVIDKSKKGDIYNSQLRANEGAEIGISSKLFAGFANFLGDKS